MIRNSTFWCESLGISYFWIKFWDSRHIQQSKCKVAHEESDVQIKNKEIRRPEAKK